MTRVCIVYDCLFPWTRGGAERWHRGVAERLAAAGHEVTYITRRQWQRDAPPAVPGVRVVAVSPGGPLYTAGGRRRIGPPLRFGLGVLWHLGRHGRRYDIVHTDAFPFFALLAAAILRPRGRFRLLVDWPEWWSAAYWRDYLGPFGGRVGWAVQRLAVRVPQQAFCLADSTAQRLRAHGANPVTVVRGLYDGPHAGDSTPRVPPPPADPPTLLFVGRLIPDKRVDALLAVLPMLPGVALRVLGDGPERPRLELAAPAGVTFEGAVDEGVVDRALRTAACLVLPSRREGYGLIVVEALAHGCPAVVVAGEDNAAVDLVADGVNGAIAATADPAALADAITRVLDAGPALRATAAAWYAAHAQELSLDASLRVIQAAYAAQP